MHPLGPVFLGFSELPYDIIGCFMPDILVFLRYTFNHSLAFQHIFFKCPLYVQYVRWAIYLLCISVSTSTKYEQEFLRWKSVRRIQWDVSLWRNATRCWAVLSEFLLTHYFTVFLKSKYQELSDWDIFLWLRLIFMNVSGKCFHYIDVQPTSRVTKISVFHDYNLYFLMCPRPHL